MSAGAFLVATGAEERAAPYVEALKTVGVPAERIRVVTPDRDSVPASSIENGRALVAGAAGLVLCGGVDVDPARYGEEVLAHGEVEIDAARDVLEWDLLAAAREARLPVWGICRGIQVLNVFLGGTLWQDLPSQRPAGVEHSVLEPADALAHPVRVLGAETRLGELLSGETPRVNSRHHQAIQRLAPGLVPVAESPDGLVEAAVLAGDEGERWWVQAVQWHPENLVAMAQHRALWEDFVRVARGEAP